MNNDTSPPDYTSESGQQGGGQFEENVKSRSTWLRLFFMIVIGFLYGVSRIVVGAVIIMQFFWVLFTGGVNSSLDSFGQSLATYTYQIIRYLTFVSDERPFPFDTDWPQGPPAD